MSFGANIRKLSIDKLKVVDRAATVFEVAVTPIFTVVRGRILVVSLIGRVVVQVQNAGASTTHVAAPGAVSMALNTFDVRNAVVGTLLLVPGNAGVAITAYLPAVDAAACPEALLWNAVPGNFTFEVITTATTPGTIMWSIAYIPLTENALVIAA